MNPRYSFAAAGLLLLTSACTQLPSRPEAALGTPWAPPAWTAWELRGRIAVQAGTEGWHASLNWRQTGETYQLELSGPLGQGTVRLRGDAQGVTLERADGQRDRAADADALLARHTGWNLPVNGLRYWVRGLAVPARAAHWERDAAGRPQRLRQDGWDIRYTAFQEQPGLGELPRRIELERDGLQARLVIDAWTPGGPG